MKTLKGLSYGAIDAQSRSVDWSDLIGENLEGFESFEAERCEECNKLIILSNGQGGEAHSDVDYDSKCSGHVGLAEGPMMNYFYPLPDFDGGQAAAAKLADLPLTLIHIADSDEWGLALTGGGMDLSWEICEGYMRLGYLPPVHYAGDLPRYAGMKLNARTRWILAGAAKSAAGISARARRASQRIRSLRKDLKGGK